MLSAQCIYNGEIRLYAKLSYEAAIHIHTFVRDILSGMESLLNFSLWFRRAR